MELKNIAIVGAGGNVGRAVVPELLKHSDFVITALVRPTSTYDPPSSNIKKITVDFDSTESLVSALANQDALLCLVAGGATKFDSQKLMIDAVVQAGVKVFFASEFSADVMSEHYAVFPTEFVGDKVKIRQYLEGLGKEGKIGWMAVNGGPFFDMWLMKGHAGFDLKNRKATVYGSGDKRLEWTSLPAIAKAMVRMLQNPDAVMNRPIFVLGVKDLTQNTLLKALEEELGGEKFFVTHVDAVQIKKESMAALERGEPGKAMRGLTIDAQFGEAEGRKGFGERAENELVGVEVVGVREAVREAFEGYGFVRE